MNASLAANKMSGKKVETFYRSIHKPKFIMTSKTRFPCLLGLFLLPLVLMHAHGANFTSGTEPAVKHGVHEILLEGMAEVNNAFDTKVTVIFESASRSWQKHEVEAFYDGGNFWRARLYVSESGLWQWRSMCKMVPSLHGQSGRFEAVDSTLRGRLLPHPRNPRQWITENGQWFLHLSDTAYFLLCSHDGNGAVVSDDAARLYMRDDVAHGITAVRCFLAAGSGGFAESSHAWDEWFFTDRTHDHLRLEQIQQADRRLRLLLDEFPEVAVQLVLFPLAGYKKDDAFWTALTAAQRERLLRQLTARYAAYPQIYWLIMNDAHFGPGFPRNNALACEVGTWLQKHDPWQHPRSTGHARKVPFAFSEESWATYIHIEHEHDLDALECARYLSFEKPVFLGEDRYEHDHGPKRDPAHMREWQRRLFWSWLLASGSTNYGGRWWSVCPYSKSGARAETLHLRPEITFTAPLQGLDSVKAIHSYFTTRHIDLADFTPDSSLLGDATSPGTPKLMRRGLDELLIYHPNAREHARTSRPDPAATATFQLDLRTSTGTYSAEWYRAEDGTTHLQSNIPAGALITLTAPWPACDVVLRLVRNADKEN
jgi:hypothetical protein